MALTNPALATPASCIADFSLIPIGAQNVSFAQQIADIQRLMQQSGLKYQMHATGTTIDILTSMERKEGPWDQVSQIIGFAHTLIHQQGIVRIQTDIRITTRTDKVQPMESNYDSVERALSTTAATAT